MSGVKLGKKEGATFWSLPVCELLCFTRLFAGFYKVLGLFEISLKHTLEGFAVESYRFLHSRGETPLSFLKDLQKEEKLLKPTA